MSKIGHTRWSRTVSGANWYSRRRSVRPFEDQELRRELPAYVSVSVIGHKPRLVAYLRQRFVESVKNRPHFSEIAARAAPVAPSILILVRSLCIRLTRPSNCGGLVHLGIVRCAEDYLAGCAIRATTYPNSPVNRDSTRRRCGLNDSTTTAAAQRPEARHNP
jgi:hypothetical protein